MPVASIPAAPGKKLDWIINNPADFRVVEQIECADGHLLSVQASGGHYCTWRYQKAPTVPAETVEVQTENAPDGWADKDIDGEGSGSETYGWVTVEEVRAFIASHGGEKGTPAPSQLDRIEELLERIADNTKPRTARATVIHRNFAGTIRANA